MVNATGKIKHAKISLAATGTIVAAVSSKKIRVLAMAVTGEAAATVTFNLESGTTDLSGIMSMVQGIPMVLPYNPAGWCETTAGVKLDATIATGKLYGMITYQEII